MKQLLLSIAFLSSVTITFGQNYLRYYELTDSAFYFWKTSKIYKADSLYKIAFKNYIGFPEDYADAAYNIWKENPEKGKQYIAKSFKYGGFIQDIEYFLPKNDIYISKKELKKIKKNNPYKFDCKRCKRKIIRMAKKDIWARFLFHWRIEKIDRQNKEKLILFATKDTMMLNRFHTGIKPNMYLSPILNHQNWETIGEIFPILRHYVRKGWVHREMLNFFLDEKAFFGKEFRYDSLNDRIYQGSKPESELKTNKYFHYSATGQYSLYHPKLKKQVALPTDPEKTIAEINKLREALFLTPLELYKKCHPEKLYPSVEKIKTFFNPN